MRDDRVHLEYIAGSIAAIDRYLASPSGSYGRQLFLDDERTQDAVLRRMETLADAAGQLSDALKRRHPEVPWPRVTGLRNVLAHAYAHLNLELIWEAIAGGLPALDRLVRDELEPLGG